MKFYKRKKIIHYLNGHIHRFRYFNVADWPYNLFVMEKKTMIQNHPREML